LREIDPLVELAYRFEEMRAARESDQGAAVRDKWHVSFHGSQFPGDDPKACGRASLYRMLDIPRSTGSYLFSNRKLIQIADAGKDIEDRLVTRWHNAGYLLTPPPWEYQMTFENADVWLTSTVDSIVLYPRAVMPVVCEVKSKYADAILEMKKLLRGPDEKHVKQLKTQIALAHEFYVANPQTVLRCHNTDRVAIMVGENGNARPVCPQHGHADCLYECELVPPEYGFLYYVSRDNPVDTHEFYVELDRDFFEAGRKKLAEWRDHFLRDELPQTNFVDKRFAHPFGWKWGELPCKWCDYGDQCRRDTKTAIAQGGSIRLSESAAIEDARALRPDYSFAEVREAVFERWGLELVPSAD
jgi:hypothetical protein